MSKYVRINLDDFNGTSEHAQASSLLDELGIQTDYWSRAVVKVSDETFARIQQWEQEHNEGQDTWKSVGYEISKETFNNASEVPVRIGQHIEYSSQL